jgi:hypothetical protein
MPGVTNFSFIPASRVGGVGPCDMTGLEYVFHAMSQGIAGRTTKVLWISLINQPWVFINGTPFILRAFSKESAALESSTGDQLRSMEAMLKTDVETEIGVERGRLLVNEVRAPTPLHAHGED